MKSRCDFDNYFMVENTLALQKRKQFFFWLREERWKFINFYHMQGPMWTWWKESVSDRDSWSWMSKRRLCRGRRYQNFRFESFIHRIFSFWTRIFLFCLFVWVGEIMKIEERGSEKHWVGFSPFCTCGMCYDGCCPCGGSAEDEGTKIVDFESFIHRIFSFWTILATLLQIFAKYCKLLQSFANVLENSIVFTSTHFLQWGYSFLPPFLQPPMAL